MAISRDISDRIKDLLQGHPEGLSITDIVKILPINRNTASRYLDTLLVTGQVEMRHFGMSKIYSLSRRIPVASVLALSSEYVLQVDQYLRIIFINVPFLNLLELTERDIVGKKIDLTCIPEFFEEDYSPLIRWINEGLVGVERRGELTLAAKGRIFSCRVTPSVFTEGQRGVSILFEDITARKLDEKRLRDSEEKFRTLFNNAADMITVHGIRSDGMPGTFLEVNDVACRMLGYTRVELLRMSPQDIIDPAMRDFVQENTTRLLAEGHAGYEAIYIAKDGQRIPVEVRSYLFQYQKKTRVVTQVRDLSEKKAAEAAIRESEARLKSIIRAAPVGIGLVTDRVIREVNDRLCEMTGYTSRDLLGKSVRIFYFTRAEFDRVGIEKYAQIAREGTGSIETRWRKKDGGVIDILLSSTLLDPGNLSTGVIFTALDITRRKQSEQATRSSEELYRHLLERSFNAVIIHKNGKILLANKAACEIAGVQSPDDLIGQPIVAFIHPDCRQLVAGRVTEMLAKPGTVMPLEREIFRRMNGDLVDVEVMATSFLDNGTPAIQVIFREIPDLEKREDHFKVSEV
jgi:PAS domain S-box-containing protein